MKIEILFPELANHYGESATIKWINDNFPDVINTKFTDEPYFVEHDVDIIFMGSIDMSEYQLMFEKLLPLKDRIQELIEKNVVFFIFGSAIDLFICSSERDGKTVFGLELIQAKVIEQDRDWEKRIYEYRWEKMVGVPLATSVLSADDSLFFLEQNGQKTKDAIRYHNFFGFHYVGPLFLQNPNFFMLLLNEKEYDHDHLTQEELLKEIYVQRVLKS